MRQRMFGVGGLIYLSVSVLMGSLLSAETPLARLQGQPKFKEGKALGYFVWKDGDTWTGGRPPVVASREEDSVEQETEQVIRFATRTDDLDGLDFKVTPATELLRFVLEIDGKPHPAEVEVGRENFKPGEHPLVVRLH